MKLSRTQIRMIENELENKETLIVRSRGRRILIKRRQRRIYPSQSSTKLVRINKEDYDKVKARAERDSTSMSVALDNMLIEAYRRKLTKLLQSYVSSKAS